MAAACGSHPEHLLRPAPLDIFRRKEAGIVLTDNLIGGVTFDPFGAGIPTDNPASRVQQKDRVVMDSVQEHPIFFFAISKRSLGSPARGVVALGAPTSDSGDQHAEDGSENQNHLGLVQSPIGVRIAQHQQSQLFFLQLPNYR